MMGNISQKRNVSESQVIGHLGQERGGALDPGGANKGLTDQMDLEEDILGL